MKPQIAIDCRIRWNRLQPVGFGYAQAQVTRNQPPQAEACSTEILPKKQRGTMSKTLSGKTAIVTGAGRGLGRSMALGLARAGANVMLTAARNRREIDQVAAEVAKSLGTGEVRQLLADVASEEDCRHVVSETVREFGGVHILVNNAGRGMRFVSEKFFDTPTKFWETDPAVWQMIVATNVNGPFLMARAAAPHMMRQRWGRIINISINHETMRRAGFSPYGPSKAALESETIIWAQDLAGTGVTVNALLPGGATDTGMVPQDISTLSALSNTF